MKKNHESWTFDISSKWYESAEKIYQDTVTPPNTLLPMTAAMAASLREKGRAILSRQQSAYQKNPLLSKQDIAWYGTVLKTGTKKDQLAALTLLIGSCPVYYTEELYRLISLANPVEKNASPRKEHILEALDSIIDLFINNILPPSRKLKYLEQRSIPQDIEQDDKVVFVWYVEDLFYRAYADVVGIMKALSMDPIEHVKSRVLNMAALCLRSVPEQEHALLSFIVNKFGDPEKKIASKVIYLLLQVLEKHPNMTLVMVEHVWENIIDTPVASSVVSLRAKLYAVTFFTQLHLSSSLSSVAAKLVVYYLRLLDVMMSAASDNAQETVDDKKSVKKKAPTQRDSQIEKMLALLLKGIQLAFKSTDMSSDLIEKELDILYDLVHNGRHWDKSLQALWLLYHLTFAWRKKKAVAGPNNLHDRFYRALYASLLDARAMHSSLDKQYKYLQLIRKSIAITTTSTRCKYAILKRLLQSCVFHEAPFVCYSLAVTTEALCLDRGLLSLVRGSSLHLQQKALPTPEKESLPYDPYKRDPEHCSSDRSPFFELLLFQNHFHPSVQKICSNLQLCIEKNQRDVKIDLDSFKPFESFSANAFLQRFSFRNPKKEKETDRPRSTTLPVSSKEYALLSQKNIPEHEIFFHKYSVDKWERLDDARQKRLKRMTFKARGMGRHSTNQDDMDIELAEEDALLDDANFDENVE